MLSFDEAGVFFCGVVLLALLRGSEFFSWRDAKNFLSLSPVAAPGKSLIEVIGRLPGSILMVDVGVGLVVGCWLLGVVVFGCELCLVVKLQVLLATLM